MWRVDLGDVLGRDLAGLADEGRSTTGRRPRLAVRGGTSPAVWGLERMAGEDFRAKRLGLAAVSAVQTVIAWRRQCRLAFSKRMKTLRSRTARLRSLKTSLRSRRSTKKVRGRH